MGCKVRCSGALNDRLYLNKVSIMTVVGILWIVLSVINVLSFVLEGQHCLILLAEVGRYHYTR